MILVDYSNISISGILAFTKGDSKLFEEDLLRHLILNSLLSYRKKYPKHGDMIICCDSGESWRKKIFPYYKASRKKDRDQSTIDWDELFFFLKKITNEIKEHMPYKVLKINSAEGDDCIAVIASSFPGPHVVISNDKDFGQLQKYSGVKQYSPLKNEEVSIDNPDKFLKELIIYGDNSDGVPNIFSDDDTFVTKKRQKSIFKTKLIKWLEEPFENFATDMDNVKRNKTMIDFRYIPTELHNEIIDTFNILEKNDRRKIQPYFIQKKLRNLLDEIQNF